MLCTRPLPGYGRTRLRGDCKATVADRSQAAGEPGHQAAHAQEDRTRKAV